MYFVQENNQWNLMFPVHRLIMFVCLFLLTGTTWHQRWWHDSCRKTLAYSLSVALYGGEHLGLCYSPFGHNRIDFRDCFCNYFINSMNIFTVDIINKSQQELLLLVNYIFAKWMYRYHATINECTRVNEEVLIWYTMSELHLAQESFYLRVLIMIVVTVYVYILAD